jgi:hypothetical protein
MEEEQIIRMQDFAIPTASTTLNLATSAPGIEFRKVTVKKGGILISTQSTFNNNGYLQVTLPQATLNGVPFSQSVELFRTGNTHDTIDLTGVVLDLNASPNMVTVLVDGLIRKNNQTVAGDYFHSEFAVKIDEIGLFEGYLGQEIFFPGEEAVKITAFNNAYVLGDLYFIDPRVSVTMVNSIGVPATITIEKLWAKNEASNVTLDITDRLGANATFGIPSPAYSATNPVTYTMTYTNENTGNSMHEMFNLKPDKVFFKIKTEINPNGPTANFFRDTSSLYANLKVQLPLFGHFDHLTLQDTFDFALNRQKEIESMEFRTKIVNGLPLTARMQVYFTDSLYHVIDSLTGSNQIIIKEAPVDPTTFLPYPDQFGLRDTSFFIDLTRMDRLFTARKILVKAVMNSANEGIPNVKIKAAHLLRVNFSALVRLKVSVNP